MLSDFNVDDDSHPLGTFRELFPSLADALDEPSSIDKIAIDKPVDGKNKDSLIDLTEGGVALSDQALPIRCDKLTIKIPTYIVKQQMAKNASRTQKLLAKYHSPVSKKVDEPSQAVVPAMNISQLPAASPTLSYFLPQMHFLPPMPLVPFFSFPFDTRMMFQPKGTEYKDGLISSLNTSLENLLLDQISSHKFIKQINRIVNEIKFEFDPIHDTQVNIFIFKNILKLFKTNIPEFAEFFHIKLVDETEAPVLISTQKYYLMPHEILNKLAYFSQCLLHLRKLEVSCKKQYQI